MRVSVHGVYDLITLKNLQDSGADAIGFDLRAQSLNLVPFHVLKTLIPFFKLHQNYLAFENDKESTINSFLDLLGDDSQKFTLQLRDEKYDPKFGTIKADMAWFYHPEGDWEKILRVDSVKEIFLPLRFQEDYSKNKKLWSIINERELFVHLHTQSASDFDIIHNQKNLSLSFDLGPEVEDSFRTINQGKLSALKLWRGKYETAAGQ